MSNLIAGINPNLTGLPGEGLVVSLLIIAVASVAAGLFVAGVVWLLHRECGETYDDWWEWRFGLGGAGLALVILLLGTFN